jgi:UDP-N-acetyl-D-glucosamine dehydrogenase
VLVLFLNKAIQCDFFAREGAKLSKSKFEDKTAKLAVIGLGYVGLPLAVEYGKAGFKVVGIDIDSQKVDQINSGSSYIIDVPDSEVKDLVERGLLSASTESSVISECNSVNICVPTPLGKTQDPDISFIDASVDAIVPYMHDGLLIILESTTYPGTTEEVILPRLSENGKIVGKDFYLAFSPERVDPGNKHYQTKNIPKVVGGVTPECTEMAVSLYSQVMDSVVPVSSSRVAETVKLLENTFRSVNIGLANEIALMCSSMGINVWEVIDAASTKPFGYMPFYPGPGLGGHCIPIDPFYLSWKAKQSGSDARFIELAGAINSKMPAHVVNITANALNSRKKPVNGSKALIVGVSYKPNIDDVRESPALDIIQLLHDKGAEVSWFDPEVGSLAGFDFARKTDKWGVDEISSYDVVIIVTPHSSVDHGLILAADVLTVDTRNALGAINNENVFSL